MIVMKFGGTSVASAERIRAVAARVRERLQRRPVVVVSALAGVTDLLIRGAGLAFVRDPEAEGVAHEVLSRHNAVIRELVPAGETRNALLAHVESVVDALRTLYTGVLYLGELTPRSLDAISGMGERISCEIVKPALRKPPAVKSPRILRGSVSIFSSSPPPINGITLSAMSRDATPG